MHQLPTLTEGFRLELDTSGPSHAPGMIMHPSIRVSNENNSGVSGDLSDGYADTVRDILLDRDPIEIPGINDRIIIDSFDKGSEIESKMLSKYLLSFPLSPYKLPYQNKEGAQQYLLFLYKSNHLAMREEDKTRLEELLDSFENSGPKKLKDSLERLGFLPVEILNRLLISWQGDSSGFSIRFHYQFIFEMRKFFAQQKKSNPELLFDEKETLKIEFLKYLSLLVIILWQYFKRNEIVSTFEMKRVPDNIEREFQKLQENTGDLLEKINESIKTDGASKATLNILFDRFFTILEKFLSMNLSPSSLASVI